MQVCQTSPRADCCVQMNLRTCTNVSPRCAMQSSITCVSEVSTACVPVCMVVATPLPLEHRRGGRKAKRGKAEEKLEQALTVKKLPKSSAMESRRQPLAVGKAKQTFYKRQGFSRRVLLRHKHWYW